MSIRKLLTLIAVFYIHQLNGQHIIVAGKERDLIEFSQRERITFSGCDTVFSFPTIDTWPSGLTFDGNNFWSYGNQTPFVYQFDTTGALLKTLPNPASNVSFYGGDVDFDGTHLWLVVEQAGTAYKIDTSNGNIVNQFALPTSNPSDPNNFGCAFDDGFIWSTEYIDKTLMKFSATTGALVDSFVIDRMVLPLKIIDGNLYGIGLESYGPYLYHFDKNTGAILDSTAWCLDYPLGLCQTPNEMWGLSSQMIMGSCRVYKFGGNILGTPPIAGINNEISLYPNPVSDEFTVSFSTDSYPHFTGTVTLTDLTGKIIRKIKQDNASELTVSVSDLSKGIYLVKIEGDDFVEVKRVVVME